ncbi:hypothetical protein Tco_0793210 [Tanacetum coccineum]
MVKSPCSGFVKVSSTRSSSSGFMNGGGIGTEGSSRTRPLRVLGVHKNKTTSGGNGFQFSSRVSNGVAREEIWLSRCRSGVSFERTSHLVLKLISFDLTLKACN